MLIRFVCSFLLLAAPLQAEIFYSYFNGKAGAIAQLQIDPNTGKITPPETLYAEEVSIRLETLYLAEDREHLVAQNEDSAQPHIVIGSADANPPEFKRVTLSDRPRHVAVRGDVVFVAGHEGRTHLVSLKDGKVLAETRPSKEIRPPGMRPEFVTITEDGKYGVSVYLQDSATGNGRGSRMVVQELPSLEVKHDLMLPREHNNLDYITGSKDKGPLPQAVYLDPKTNTVAIICRLYGAVAVADLDAALEKGEWKNFQYIATSADGSFGKGFPDRARIFTVGGKNYLYVSNASIEGGVSFIDLAERKLIAHVETGERGLREGVILPDAQKFVTVRTGFYWSRGDEELEAAHQDGKELLVFDLSKLSSGEVTLAKTQWGDYAYNVSSVPGTEQFVVTSVRREDNGLDLVVVDLNKMEPVDRAESLGVIRNFVVRENK